MVLQKNSATLSYPGEVSEPLNADHHHVCKYPNRNDPSYKSVKSILKTLVSAYRDAGTSPFSLRVNDSTNLNGWFSRQASKSPSRVRDAEYFRAFRDFCRSRR